MTEEAKQRRKQLDHERYMRNREERLRYQREYYAAHREQCKAAIMLSNYRRYGMELKNMNTRNISV